MKTDKALKFAAAFYAVILTVSCVICYFLSPVACVVCFCALSLCFLCYYILTKKRYDKIGELGEYLSRVASGDLSTNPADYAEGELSILQSNIYKVILCYQQSG